MNMKQNDFLKFAVSQGLNSMHVENVMNASAGYINPTILEERMLNVTQMDVFSRLMMDRVIFLGTEVNDYTANVIQAQLLYLNPKSPQKYKINYSPTHRFATTNTTNINSTKTPTTRNVISAFTSTPQVGRYMLVWASTTPCSSSTATSLPSVQAWQRQWEQCYW